MWLEAKDHVNHLMLCLVVKKLVTLQLIKETIPMALEAEAPSRSGKSQTGAGAGWNHHLPFLFLSQCSAVPSGKMVLRTIPWTNHFQLKGLQATLIGSPNLSGRFNFNVIEVFEDD